MLGFSVLISFYIVFYLVLMIGWKAIRKNKNKTIDSKINPSEVTVIIPFRNEYENLIHLIEKISTLKTVPCRFLFINDHSEDNWRDLFIDSNRDLIEVISLEKERQGKKAAVQKGVESSSSKFILSWDADIDFKIDYFNQIQQIDSADLVILPVHFKSENYWQSLGEIDFYLANFINQTSAYWKRPIMCNGANLLFKRKAYLDVINLKEHEHILSGDDMFLLKRMNQERKEINLVSDACSVSTSSPDTFRGYLKQRTRWIGKSFYIQDNLLNFWAGLQFLFAISFFVLFTYYAIQDLQLFVLFLTIKSAIDVIFLSFYFKSINKNLLTLFIPLYGLIFPIYNLFIFFSFFSKQQEWKGRKLYQ